MSTPGGVNVSAFNNTSNKTTITNTDASTNVAYTDSRVSAGSGASVNTGGAISQATDPNAWKFWGDLVKGLTLPAQGGAEAPAGSMGSAANGGPLPAATVGGNKNLFWLALAASAVLVAVVLFWKK